MEECIKQLCSYLVAQQLVEQNATKGKSKTWWTYAVMMGLLLAVVIFLPVIFCFFKSFNFNVWKDCVFLIATIPTSIVCLTYLASLLIKRMPDRNKEYEQRCRMVRNLMLEINRCKKQHSSIDDATVSDIEKDNKKEEIKQKINATIKNAFDAISRAVSDIVDIIMDNCNKNK